MIVMLSIPRHKPFNEGFSITFAEKWWGQLTLLSPGPKKWWGHGPTGPTGGMIYDLRL